MRRRARMVDLARELAGRVLEGRRSACSAARSSLTPTTSGTPPRWTWPAPCIGLGARVTVYDPAAMDRARQVHPELEYAGSIAGRRGGRGRAAAADRVARVREADPEVLGKVVARRNIADGRNALDAARWRAAGWHYRALGASAGGATSA